MLTKITLITPRGSKIYAKLFASLYQGTLRGNTHGLVVFTNMLAHADSAGWVDIHPKAIAEEVGLTVEQVRAAIAELEAPDPESRSPEHEGRRIILLDEHRNWGWKIVNHGKYRSIRDEADRREQNRIAQEKFRNKNKVELPEVSNSKPRKPKSAHTEAEVEVNPPTPQGGFDRFWAAYPKKVGKGAAEKAFSKAPINGHLADVLSALDRQKQSEQWRRDGGQFIPNPATWLNQRRWEDGDPTPPQPPRLAL